MPSLELQHPGVSDSEKSEKHPSPVEVEDGETTLQRTSTASSMPLPSKARTISLVVILTGAAILNSMSVQSAVIVLPTIGNDLNIPSARQQWIVSAYNLTFGCFLLLWGRLADVYGKRIIFILGSAWVTAITICIPFMPNEISFDFMRGLQGMGAAANVPCALGILGVTFPPGKAKNYAFSFYSAGAPLGAVFGNLFGGLVAQYVNWKWIFWIIAMIAAMVTVGGHFIIPHPVLHPGKEQVKTSVDWVGGTLVTVSLLALMFALTEGNVVGWSTPWVPVLIVVSFIIMAMFVVYQLYLEKKTQRKPLLKATIFKNKQVSAAMVVMAVFNMAFNNFLVFATYYFQEYQGHDAIHTTLRFIPTGVVGVCTCFVTSQLLARVKTNYVLIFGLTSVSIAGLLFAVPIPPSTTYWAYAFPAMCLSVFGADTIYPSLVLFTAHSLPREDQAIGGALINAVAQVGRAVGLAIGTAIQVAVEASAKGETVQAAQNGSGLHSAPYLKGLRAAEWLNFSLCVVGVLLVVVALRGIGKVGLFKK